MLKLALGEIKDELQTAGGEQSLDASFSRSYERLVEHMVGKVALELMRMARSVPHFAKYATITGDTNGLAYLPPDFLRPRTVVVKSGGSALIHLSDYEHFQGDYGTPISADNPPTGGAVGYYRVEPRGETGKYNTGTVTVSAAGTALTSSADWSSDVEAEDYIQVVAADGTYVRRIKIATVGTTSHTLARAWPETALSGASFAINPRQARIQTFPKSSKDHVIHYYRFPEPAYADADVIDLPDGAAHEAVMLACRLMVERRDDPEIRSDIHVWNRRDVKEAIGRAVLELGAPDQQSRFKPRRLNADHPFHSL